MPDAAQFAIVSPSGDTIILATSADQESDFGLLTDTSGLGFAEREIQVTASPSEGGRLRSIRVALRDGTLSVLAFGADDTALQDNVRRLAAAVRSLDDKPLPKLTATYPSGEAYEIPFVYANGAEDLPRQIGGGAVVVSLNVIFPDPFWTAVDAAQFSVVQDSTVIGLLPELAKLQIKSSGANGTMQIQNPGEVSSPPIWRITGPATSITATLGSKSWTLAPVAAGEVITIDAAAKTATLADGTNVYNRLSAAPKLFAIPAGPSEVTVQIIGADANSSASCFFRPRMEVIL